MSKTRITTTYRSDENEELGFSIIETETALGNEVELWVDECEGGEAHEIDWNYVDDFESKEDAYNYIIENYGPVTEIE